MDSGSIIALVAICVTIVGGLIWLIFSSGRTYNRVEVVERDIQDIKSKVADIPELIVKVDTLWTRVVLDSHSPRQLNDYGRKVLVQSGIGEIIEARYDSILTAVSNLKPQNAYQAEERVIEVVGKFREDQDLLPQLERGAFQSGLDVDMLLLVGAIHIRDRVIESLGFKFEDIDRKPV